MNKVLTINLNGRAFQLEEAGFDALQTYLAEAGAHLAEDPGKTEILADLEQAIAEKCDKLLNQHKSVVTAEEVRTIIDEMGSVEGDAEAAHAAPPAGAFPKRIYRIKEGSYIFGVSTGFAAYFGIDVVLMRVIFIVLTVLTGGGFIFAYVLMMVFIPEADTMQEKAAAYGAPFNAQELVNRVKREAEEWSAHFAGTPAWRAKAEAYKWKHEAHQWKRDIKNARREARRAARYGNVSYRQNPFMGLIRTVLACFWILALLSLVTTGALFGWMIPAGIPLWVAIILLFILYQAVTGPMRGAHHHNNVHGTYSEWDGLVDGIMVLFLAIAFGWAYLHVPQVNAFVHHPIDGLKTLGHTIKSWF